jgi:hypothetical protein
MRFFYKKEYFNVLTYFFIKFLKRKCIGNKGNKIKLLFYFHKNFYDSYNLFFRKYFLYKKYFYYYFIKKNIFYILSYIDDFKHFFYHYGLIDYNNHVNFMRNSESEFISFLNDRSWFCYNYYNKTITKPKILPKFSLFYLFKFFYFVFFIKIFLYRYFSLKKSNFYFLPCKNGIFTVLRSPHKDKKSREQFQFDLRKIGFSQENFFFFFEKHFLFHELLSYFMNNFKLINKLSVFQ